MADWIDECVRVLCEEYQGLEPGHVEWILREHYDPTFEKNRAENRALRELLADVAMQGIRFEQWHWNGPALTWKIFDNTSSIGPFASIIDAIEAALAKRLEKAGTSP